MTSHSASVVLTVTCHIFCALARGRRVFAGPAAGPGAGPGAVLQCRASGRGADIGLDMAVALGVRPSLFQICATDLPINLGPAPLA